MYYIPFYELCPETAISETRVIQILSDLNEFKLPPGEYSFLESFCDSCDCRRVFLNVHKDRKAVATIAYGWEKFSFYQKAFKNLSGTEIKLFKGPGLDPYLHQSELAGGVFQLFMKELFTDKEYMYRIRNHYAAFKRALKYRKTK